jgi:hypothetical protein
MRTLPEHTVEFDGYRTTITYIGVFEGKERMFVRMFLGKCNVVDIVDGEVTVQREE